MLTSAILFAVFMGVAIAAHQVADHVFGQNDKIAANKAKPGRVGWSHIAQHVFAYHVVMFVMLLITCVALNLPVTFLGVFASILFSALSHGFIDRRWPVKWILDHTGSPGFAQMQAPLCGMYLADQGLHYFCLWISALLFAVL
jgi:Protein of unknown function (DUF3307)